MLPEHEALYERLESLSKVLESSGRLDTHEHPDAYRTILDTMRVLAALTPETAQGTQMLAPIEGAQILAAIDRCRVRTSGDNCVDELGHVFTYFGDQPKRRCAFCNVVENVNIG